MTIGKIHAFFQKFGFYGKKLRGTICETASHKFKTPPELLLQRGEKVFLVYA